MSRRRHNRQFELEAIQNYVQHHRIQAKKAPKPNRYRDHGWTAEGWSLSDQMNETDWEITRSRLVERTQTGRQGMK